MKWINAGIVFVVSIAVMLLALSWNKWVYLAALFCAGVAGINFLFAIADDTAPNSQEGWSGHCYGCGKPVPKPLAVVVHWSSGKPPKHFCRSCFSSIHIT